MKPCSDEVSAKEKLVWRFVSNLIFCKQEARVSAHGLFYNGHSRDRLFAHFLKEGYLTDNQADIGAAITRKAFDEVTAMSVDLAAMYDFQSNHSDDGKVWIIWERLRLSQKKSVILAMEADPDSYDLLMAESGMLGRRIKKFSMGDGIHAVHAVGGWDRFLLCVSNDAVRRKDQAFRRVTHEKRFSEGRLLWFLQKNNILTAEESVPMIESSPFASGPAAPGKMSRDRHLWPQDLLNVISETRNGIQAMQKQLVVLEKFRDAVQKGGGWQSFLASYEEEIQNLVEEKVAEEQRASQAKLNTAETAGVPGWQS